MISKERLKNIFINMVKVDSPSKNEYEMVKWLVSYLYERGIKAKIDKVGEKFGGNSGNVIAYIKGGLDLEPVCFQAHMDQVSPCLGVKPIECGNIIKSDGSTTLGGDDKAGIAAVLEAIEHIKETNTPHRDIYLMFSVCEEVGMFGCKYLDIDDLPVKNIVIIDSVGEPGAIAYKAPSKEHIDITFYGKKAHAGIEPEKGINAIVVASHAISNMNIGRIDSETTSNIGEIKGGGSTNIVTDSVSFNIEIRSHSMEKLKKEIENMKICCEEAAKKFNTTYEFKHENSYPSFELSKDSYIYKLTEKSMQLAGITPNPMIIGGGSDANILAGKGYDCAIISMGVYNPHALNEYLNLDELYITTKAVINMMTLEI
ncbi:M20/M25/M40 family metallo-hydrolase [Romboutsia sp. 1001713B170207_170306_H8]|uniref:M20/M25/M40 family metallo-hydrolase n=1 Tax=Romboutsia sp. 1001713B170207_170306_H8 TaxID=2787112 RepID=UPI000823087D|nr:M20/M25/M40 family metallo-hydrolase [Romboutsia sp. 1001713B170207_170306_H8]SCI13991.1 Peptidase T [uncultured Clostridium sp.]